MFRTPFEILPVLELSENCAKLLSIYRYIWQHTVLFLQYTVHKYINDLNFGPETICTPSFRYSDLSYCILHRNLPYFPHICARTFLSLFVFSLFYVYFTLWRSIFLPSSFFLFRYIGFRKEESVPSWTYFVCIFDSTKRHNSKTSGYITSQLQNIPSYKMFQVKKHPKVQNVPTTKCSKPQNGPTAKCSKLKTSQAT